MGKTNPTYRDALQQTRQQYAPAERAVRGQFRPAWDTMWAHAENHADIMHIHNPTDPMEGVLLSVCLGQQLEIADLQDRLDELEE